MNKSNKTIAKNTGFLYVRMIIVLLVSLYTTRAILSILGVDDYGVYNVVAGFVSMFSFLNTSLTNGIQRFYNFALGKGSSKELNNVYNVAVRIQILIALITVLLVEVIGIWYVNYKMVVSPERLFAANCIFQTSVLSFVFLILQIPYSAVILAYEKMDYYALVSIIDVFLKLFIVLSLPYIPFDQLILFGVLNLCISIGNFLFYSLYVRVKFSNLYLVAKYDKSDFKNIFNFSGWNVLETFAWLIQDSGINMIMNLFFGPAINAARAITVQIQGAIRGFCTNMVSAFRPQLIQSYAEGNYARTKDMMYILSKVIFVLFFILSVPVMLEIDTILDIWLGDNLPPYTSILTILLLISMFLRNFIMAISQVVQATGKMKNYTIATSFIALLLIPISYLALYKGASPSDIYILNIIACILLYFASLYICNRIFPLDLRLYLKSVLFPCIILSLLSFIVPWGIHSALTPGVIRIIVVLIANTSITVILAYYILLTANERMSIKGIIKRKR